MYSHLRDTTLDDHALLREYADHGSEEAFATLVTRHINKVYSVALRHTGNQHQAEEITQAVFVILARKSNHLGKKVILEGWLYQAARLTATTFIRGEIRRAHREQEAYMQTALNETEAEVWTQIAPLLDTAMATLNETDRHAVVLRFFYDKSMQEVGTALGGSEGAARLRVHRAMEKLRRFFTKRGVDSTAAIIAGAISANSVQLAPMALAKTVTAVAITKGTAASGSTLTLIKGALKIMAWTKVKMTVAAGVAVLLAGTATLTVVEIESHRSWRSGGFNSEVLDQQPPQVQILPSKFHGNAHGWGTQGRMAGTGATAATVVSAAYGFATTARTMLATDLPEGRYDYIASLTNGNPEALQREVKKLFGVAAKFETRETNVMVLKVKTQNAPGLKPSTASSDEEYETWTLGHYESKRKFLGHLTCVLEQDANVPFVDQTGFTNAFDINLNWRPSDLKNQNWDNINVALAPLGLEVVPGRDSIAMLVVDKAN